MCLPLEVRNFQKSMWFLEQQGKRLCFQAKVNDVNEGKGHVVAFLLKTQISRKRVCVKNEFLCVSLLPTFL